MGSHCPRFGDYVQDEHLSRWLLASGADATARGDMDITPTSVAVSKASIGTVQLLLERGGNVNNGQLLHFAVQRKSDALEVIEILLDLECPINALMFQDDPQSWAMYQLGGAGTALFSAAEMGRADIVIYLLQRGADPAIAHSKGTTVLHAAETHGRMEVVKALKRWTNMYC